MFSVDQKRKIADKIQTILRETNHPELPDGEIKFHLHVSGEDKWSWADIENNGAIDTPDINPWNEFQGQVKKKFKINDLIYYIRANRLHFSRITSVKEVENKFSDSSNMSFGEHGIFYITSHGVIKHEESFASKEDLSKAILNV